ncbi:hypothetical protein CRE_19093 [Caenorhabditis remanei]|uniref:Uncharacterized protein n=1 Tax=Caenorhabditis remanei TaxID=31234 RepID=E3LJS7_CAERE|nr:hypothetical protein CRE_19093 [Caenorhabditis remanei]
MVSWSQIPPEIKRHVVQKLDFMSRISLKNTSHLDRQIVESTKLYIPRARFGYKDGKSLVVIYTGIEKFLRLEMEKCGNGVVIQKSENSYDHSKFARKFMPSIDTFSLGLFVLKSLLIDINIEVIEWDLPEESEEGMVERIVKFLSPARFQVKEMACLWNSTESFQSFCFQIVVWEHLKSIRRIGVFPTSGSLQPIFIHEDESEFNGRPCYKTSITMSYLAELFGMAFDFSFHHQNPICANYRLKNGTTPEKEKFQRKEEDDTVTRCYASECGTWEHKMLKENEDRLKQRLDSQKCGTSWLCENHADPFDYWYHHNFPLRLAQEPDWNAVICIGSDFLLGLDDLFDPMIKAAEEAEEKRLENVILDTSTSSWGFRRLDEGEVQRIPHVMGHKSDDVKKTGGSKAGKPKGDLNGLNMRDIMKCLEEVGIVEDIQWNSEDSEENSGDGEDPDVLKVSKDSEDSKNPEEFIAYSESSKQSLLQKFKLFSFIFLTPIVVSFVFYFVSQLISFCL